MLACSCLEPRGRQYSGNVYLQFMKRNKILLEISLSVGVCLVVVIHLQGSNLTLISISYVYCFEYIVPVTFIPIKLAIVMYRHFVLVVTNKNMYSVL